ncbi:hypothetical protein K440DRAFT_176020 [Wilcoxina mikolae CBS 423.85]|nr:hypothetical protein K440DRAFT_176020 [Wilcoxina mikolae CBS 423.85]
MPLHIRRILYRSCRYIHIQSHYVLMEAFGGVNKTPLAAGRPRPNGCWSKPSQVSGWTVSVRTVDLDVLQKAARDASSMTTEVNEVRGDHMALREEMEQLRHAGNVIIFGFPETPGSNVYLLVLSLRTTFHAASGRRLQERCRNLQRPSCTSFRRLQEP